MRVKFLKNNIRDQYFGRQNTVFTKPGEVKDVPEDIGNYLVNEFDYFTTDLSEDTVAEPVVEMPEDIETVPFVDVGYTDNDEDVSGPIAEVQEVQPEENVETLADHQLDETSRQIVSTLSNKTLSIQEIAESLDVKWQSLIRPVKELMQEDLIDKTEENKYKLNA